MKILTWNVNGVRSALSKGAAKRWNFQQFDVICLQEIKATPDQLTEGQRAQLDGMYAIWNPAVRKGYSGVATFSKVRPSEIRLGLGNERFDSEGRVIQTLYDDFVLFNLYFPNGQRDHGRLNFKLEFYAYLLDICDHMHARDTQIILTGDFNTAHQPIDLKNPKQNKNTSGFMPEERAWVDRFLEHGFVDVYRKMYPNREEYTWWTYRANARNRNIGWRSDYFLISKKLVDRVQDIEILDDVMGSDHCPVLLYIQ